MPIASTRVLVAACSLAVASSGCASPCRTSAPATSAATPTTRAASADERHFYRFDFVLSTEGGSDAPTTTSFTLSLREQERGEMMVGKNVALAPTTATLGALPASPRQDVGLRIGAVCQAVGDDVLIVVNTEMSSLEPPSTIRKIVARGDALATLGKPTLVTTLDDDHQRRRLTVTATRLR